MSESIPDRRLAENEVLFRSLNESVQERIDEINKAALEAGNAPVRIAGDEPLFFYCECADEKCRQRIKVTPKEYQRIHTRRDTFTVVPGHAVPHIEDIVAKEKEYWVVRKHELPPAPAETNRLNRTEPDATGTA